MTATDRGRPARRTDYAVYVLSALLAVAGIGQLAQGIQDRRLPPPKPVSQSVGLRVDDLIESRLQNDNSGLSPGRARVIYLFAQKCQFCEGQKDHMRDILSALDPEAVLTATDESDTVAAGYWSPTSTPLAMPGRINVEAMTKLGVSGVPALLFVGPDNRVTSAYIGVATAWDLGRFRSELARASKLTKR